MSPLIIVGILISTALADVSHVLSRSAHPPPNPSDVNSLAGSKSAFQTGNPQDFWWMASNSPLKASYDYYKKCSSRGNCLPPINVVSEGAQITKSANSADAHFGPINVQKNPFLNGDYQSGSVSSSSSFSSAGCTACSSGSKSNGVAAFHSGTKIDITNNPFLNGQIAKAGNGETIKSENGFLGVQPKKPGFATTHPLSNKKPFATFPPVGQQSFVLGGDADTVECRGKGYICAAKDLCVNGVVNKSGEGIFQVRSNVQYCNGNTEVCCQLANSSERPPFDIILPTVSGKSSLASNINGLVDISAGKSSVTGSTLKFSGGPGSSPGQIQVLIDHSEDVKPQVYHIGESGSQTNSNTSKPVRDITSSANSVFSSTVDYSDVQFPSDVRFASTIRGPAYLPPIGGPSTPPPKTPDLEAPTPPVIITYQPSVPTSPRPIPTTPRSCPLGTILTASGICETPAPTCQFGTIQRPDGSCVEPPPPSPLPPIPTPRPCPPGTFLTDSGSCEAPSPPTPTCPFGTIQRPDGTCESPRPPVTIKSCPLGTHLAADGNCIKVGISTTPQPCPPGKFLTASGICGSTINPTPRPSCPPGTFQVASGACEYPNKSTTTGYDYSKPCPPGTFKTSAGLCERPIVTTQRPQCSPGSYLTPSGICETPTPKPPPRPFEPTASREYLPPVTPAQYVPSITQKPQIPSITSKKPFQPFTTPQTPQVTSPRPFQSSVTSEKPSITPRIPSITTQKPYYPSVITLRPYKPPETTQRPSIRPNPFLTTPTTFPPLSCQEGFITGPTGSCIPKKSCPPGYKLSATGIGCERFTTPSVPSSPNPYQNEPCNTGQILSLSGNCIYPPLTTTTKPLSCSFGQKLSPSGICEHHASTQSYDYPKPTTLKPTPSCGPNQISSPSGSCIYQAQSTPKPIPTLKPACAPGQIPASSGIGCVYFSSPSTPRPVVCSPGQKLSSSGLCQYPTPTRGYEYPKPTTSKSSISCGPEQILSSSGSCVYSSQPSVPTVSPESCGIGQVLSPSGSCVYPTQSTPRPSPFPKPFCGPGKVPTSTGFGCTYPSSPSTSSQVTCSPGQKLSSSGVCQYPTSTQSYEYTKPTTAKPRVSCGSGQIETPSGSCIYPSQPSSKPTTTSPERSCGFGQVLSPYGSCQYSLQSTPKPSIFPKPSCGPGQVPSPSGFGCIYPSSPNTPNQTTCSPGQMLSPSGVCQYPTPTQDYGYPKPTTPKATISCRSGQILTSSGSCVYSSQQPSSTSEPSCRLGQVLSPSGSCIYPTQSTPRSFLKPSCETGQVPSPSGFECIYPFSPSTPNQTTCLPGQKLSPSGVCHYPTPTQSYEYPKPTTPKSSITCRPGQTLTSSGSCVYSSQHPSSTPEPSCKLGQVLSPSGSCIYLTQSTPRPFPIPSCGPRQVPSPSGFGCVYPSSPSTSSQTTCSPGQNLSPSGVCQYTTPTQGYEYPKPSTSKPSTSCRPGQVLTSSGSCVYSSQQSTSEPSCEFGQVLSASGSCIYPTQSTPRPQPKSSCSAGQIPSPSGFGCVYPASSSSTSGPTCPPGQELSTFGVCQYPTSTRVYEYPKPTTQKPSKSCRPGQILSSSGSCVYAAQPPSESTLTSKPSCGFGQVLSSTGSCIFSPQSTPRPQPKPSCGSGQIPSPLGFGCIYPPSSSSTSRPTCLPGQELSTSGICQYPTPTRGYEYPKPTTEKPTISCLPGQILSSSGSCTYPSLPPSKPTPTSKSSCGFGQLLSSSGSCSFPTQSTPRPQPKPSCGAGQIKSPSGFGCVYPSSSSSTTIPTCSPGQELSASGVCQYPILTKPTTEQTSTSCRPGEMLNSSGSCVHSSPSPLNPTPTPKISCEFGQVLSSSGTCTYPSQSTRRPKPSCGAGQIPSPSGFGCVYPLSSTPTCSPGQQLSATGVCQYPLPTEGSLTTAKPSLSCRPGQIPSPSGLQCIYPSSSSTPRPTLCQPGQILSSSGICQDPFLTKGYEYPKPSTPFCSPGQILSPSGSCIYLPQSTPKPRPSCAPGQILSTSGIGCEYPKTPKPTLPSLVTKQSASCPFGTKLSPITNECITAPSRATVGYDYSKPTSPLPQITPKPVCKFGQILTSSGTCIYPSSPTSQPQPSCGVGLILSSSGICTHAITSTEGRITQRPISCPAGQVIAPSGYGCVFSGSTQLPKPSCGPGQIPSSSGLNCEYEETPKPLFPGGTVTKPSTSCPFGERLSPITNECIVSPTTGYEYSRPATPFEPSASTIKPSRSRECSPGQILSSSGVCIYSSRPTSIPQPKPSSPCGPDQELSLSGSCIYSSGSTKPIPSREPSCRFGQVLSSSGICSYPLQSTSFPHPSEKPSCGPGQVLSPSGSCNYPSQPIPRPTPSPTTGYEYPKPSPSFVPNYTGPSTLRPTTPKICSSEKVLSPFGVCIYPSKVTPSPQPGSSPSCSQGQELSVTGSCIYTSHPTATGYEFPKQSTSFTPTYTGSSTVRPTTSKQCAPGQIVSSSGICIYSSRPTSGPRPSQPRICRPDQVLSLSGSCIYSVRSTSTPKPLCDPGQIVSLSGTCIYSSQSTPASTSVGIPGYEYTTPSTPFKTNYPGLSTIRPNTLNQCSPGQILSSSGSCIYQPKPTLSPESSPQPSCSQGKVPSPSGLCIYPSRTTNKPSCLNGQLLSPTGICTYPSPTPSPQTTYKPSCGPGKTISPTGSCIYPSQTTQRPFPSSRLSCRPGQELSSSGVCIYSSQSTTIPQPTFSSSCAPGQILNQAGSCIYPSHSTNFPISKQCPPGSKPSAFASGCEYPRPTSGTFTGYNYPKPSTPFEAKSQCPFGARPGPSGACERPFVSTTTPRYDISSTPSGTSRQCPVGTQLSSSGFCEQRSTVPPHPVTSITPRYEYPKNCPSGTVKTPSGLCQSSETSPQCPLGTTLGPAGSCEPFSEPTSRPQCPFGTRLGPNGSCESSKLCPLGTYKTPSGDCKYTVTSSTPGYGYPKPCPPGTIKTSSGDCKTASTPSQRQTCPPGSSLSPSGKCQYPSPTSSIPGQPIDTNNQFTPSYPTKIPYRPTTTPRPADGYIYNKPTPTFGYPSSTLIPNSNSINQVYVPSPTTYLPPVRHDESSQADTNTEVRIPPSTTTESLLDVTGESINSITRVVTPETRKPPVYNGEQNEAPPAGCAAALKCVQEIYCTADGFVSPVPVVLTKDQELLKVPTTVCKDEESGIIGKCCRDPNYKDPWPSANLVNGVDDGQYKEDNLYGQHDIGNNRLVRSSNVTRSGNRPVRNLNSPGNIQGSRPTCGQRNHNTQPSGSGPIDANFAEYPWQAMILRDSNRSLLCGGAIIRRNAVLTAARCVEGLDTSDVLIKGGEWKLGIDEEPLPFQIVKVAAILRHPGYKAGSYENDLAVLVLQEKLRPSKNVGTICLPQPNQIPTSNCIATGWGKRILQLHAKGALMHHIKVNVMDSQQCQQTLQQNFQDSIQNYSPNTLCGFSDIDQCKVDYGSALACSDGQGHYTLSGIYAWDTGCKQEGQIGGYVAPDVEWIDFTLTKSLKDLKKIEKEYLLSRV